MADTLSRVEDILRATVDGEPYNEEADSRVERLLLELKGVIEAGGGGGGGTVNLSGTLLASGWNDTAPYTQTITIDGLTEELQPLIDLAVSDNIDVGVEEIEQWSYITKAISGANTLTVYCYSDKPTIDLNIKVKSI